jgi:hypothetical protein
VPTETPGGGGTAGTGARGAAVLATVMLDVGGRAGARASGAAELSTAMLGGVRPNGRRRSERGGGTINGNGW